MSRFGDKYKQSPYLSLDDFGDEPETFTVRDTTEETFREGPKDVLYYVGKDKGHVLSQGNGKILGRLLPKITDTPDLVGGTVTFHKQWFDIDGEKTRGMKLIAATLPAGGAPPKPEPAKTALAEAIDDDIPF